MDSKFSLQTAQQFSQHYSDESFWKKLKRIASQASAKLIYPALQLYYLLKSDEVKLSEKAIIIGALGYLIFPADAIPDFIPALGLTDDLTAILLALRTVKHNLTPAICQQAQEQTDRLINR